MGIRAPPVNWKQQVINLLDSYDIIYELSGISKDTALAHAVQKDAIQNSMDAYNPNNPDEWTVIFNLHYSARIPIVTITDTGTYGLTGKTNLDEEALSKLDFKRYMNERWSRFEALGYANPDPRARGARGQGKFIFIGSSEKKEMIYETLRADGVYRIGHWITKGAKPLIEPLEGDKAREYLKKYCPDLEPLNKVGTRIIIPYPKKELARAFIPLLHCDLARYISETWWERLLEGWNIYVRNRDYQIRVAPPQLYREARENPKNIKLRQLTDVKIGFGKSKGAKVKELVIAYSEDEIPPMLRGISVQRRGMKVMSFDIRYGNEHIEERYKNHVFGWITFNDKAEQELRKYENTTHYSFKKLRGSIAHEILGTRGWLASQIRKFAEEILGILPEKKKQMVMEKTQFEVLHYLNTLARSFGYRIRIPPPGKGKEIEKRKPPKPAKPVRIQMPPLVFPSVTRRVDFNERVYGTKARIVNDSKRDIPVQFNMALYKSTRGKLYPKPVLVLAQIDRITLQPKGKTSWYGKDFIEFSKSEFTHGQYSLMSEIIGLEGEDKGKRLDRITRAIYLEVNPPPVEGLFREMQPAEFPLPIRKRRYSVNEENGSIIIYYNTEHPAYKRVNMMREIAQQNKVKGVNPLYDYLLDIGLAIFVTEDLESNVNLLGTEGMKIKKIIERDEQGVVDDVRRKVLAWREKLHQELWFDAPPPRSWVR